jgi:hypothetical protein
MSFVRMNTSHRRVAIFLWAALMPFAAFAGILSLVLWTHPEWHSQDIFAPLALGTSILIGGAGLFLMRVPLVWRALSFAAYAVVLVPSLLYFGAFFLCFFWRICGL